MMKHAEKTDALKSRLESFSKGLFVAGIAVMSYAAYSYVSMTAVTKSNSQHKLGAGHESSFESASAFNGLSVAIWGLVAAKAKTGLNAVSKGEVKSVGDALKQAATLMLMIAVASGFNIYAQADLSQTTTVS